MASFLTVPAEGSSLSRYLEEIRRFPMLEPEEEYMLAKAWVDHGDKEAYTLSLHDALPLVPIFTSDQERRMYSWIAARIHHMA